MIYMFKLYFIFVDIFKTMTSGSISKWNLKEGDRFNVGAVICDVETDNATVSYDATDSGYLAKILVEAREIQSHLKFNKIETLVLAPIPNKLKRLFV